MATIFWEAKEVFLDKSWRFRRNFWKLEKYFVPWQFESGQIPENVKYSNFIFVQRGHVTGQIWHHSIYVPNIISINKKINKQKNNLKGIFNLNQ
jgi:hypothetical protein